MLSPLPLFIFRDIRMPLCLHAALVAVFLLVLECGRWWYAMPVLFLLQVARESRVLLMADSDRLRMELAVGGTPSIGRISAVRNHADRAQDSRVCGVTYDADYLAAQTRLK